MKNIHNIIKATANQSKRTFTLRKMHTDGSIVKYRTNKMNQEDFNSTENNTPNDWRQFLKSDEYSIV